MKNMLLLAGAWLWCTTFSVQAQRNTKETWSKVRVWLDNRHTMKTLASMGVETDHGKIKQGVYFESAFSGKELERLKAAGFRTEILVKDVVADFQQRSQGTGPGTIQADNFVPSCRKVEEFKTPVHWRLGSMGGHLTYEEMLQHLDSMRILYPNLISSKFAIDATQTHEGRSIMGVRLSDNPNQTEPAEPQALFSAVHHAREPVGMHQLIYFMWYLLENYAGNAEIKALVDNSELYFVPCLNPDGYIFNQTEQPLGGGMWRKNRRDNLDGTMGVDLNRNYGYNWGWDDFGSSPNSETDTYRGTEGFSEPETQAMRNFCRNQNFKIALNYHTYSNLIIHPWGYENIACEDSTLFRNLTREMAIQNNYRVGTGMQVLNYNSNGSSDDYMYATEPEKDKIFAMTPEVGDWFWPESGEILGLCQETMHQNLTLVRSLHPTIRFADSTGLFHYPGSVANPGNPRLRYKVQRIGTSIGNATFTLIFTPFGPNVAGLSPITKVYPNLLPDQEVTDSLILPAAAPALALAEPVLWRVEIGNGLFTSTDTLLHYGGIPAERAENRDACESTAGWTGSWVSVNGGLQGKCFKQSVGLYTSPTNSFFRRTRPYDLRNPSIRAAELSFWTRYEIERNYDYAAIALSTDSGATWINVCTDNTTMSSPFSNQAGPNNIIPIWDGNQYRWQKEYLNLQDFLGQKVWLQFTFVADDFLEFDGFSVDEIRLKTNQIQTTTLAQQKGEMAFLLYPNPSGGTLQVEWYGENQTEFQLFDGTGRNVQAGRLQNGVQELNLSGLPQGMFWLEARGSNGIPVREKVLIRR